MKVIFLDIDGVLNSHQWNMAHYREEKSCVMVGPEHFCPVSVSNLRWLLVSDKDLKIVVSSSWRKIHSLDSIRGMLSVYGICSKDIIDITPCIWGPRGDEIRSWLDKHSEVTDFVVLDDDCDMTSVKDKFVQTDGEHGFMWKDAQKAADILNVKLMHGR